MADNVEATADLSVQVSKFLSDKELPLDDVFEALAFVMGAVMSQLTDKEHDIPFAVEASALILQAYKFHCGADQVPANITVQ